MPTKLTDFELAAGSSALALIGDTYWLVNDIVHAGRFDHMITGTILLIGLAVLAYSLIVHHKTGAKPVQSHDDIDYRIELYMAKKSFAAHALKEKCLKKH